MAVLVLDSTLRLSAPLILAALAGLFSERSGIIDIGLEGKMLGAAFAAASAAALTGSPWAGLAAGIGVSVALAMVHGYACITHRGNQVVSGLALNILLSGLTAVLGIAWFAQGGRTPQLPGEARFLPLEWPGAAALREVPLAGPIYSELLSGHNLVVYLAFLAVPAVAWVLYRTRFGLRLRAVGESPHSVDTAGIPVHGLRYRALLGTGIACGVAGAYLSLAQSAGFINDMTAGKGYIALAALIFGKWRPVPAMFACLLFGLLGSDGHPAAGCGPSRHRAGAGAARAGAALRTDRGVCSRASSAGPGRPGPWACPTSRSAEIGMARLDHMQCSADARKAARRRMPRLVFEFIDGGAGEERATRRNRDALARIELLPRVLVNVESRRIACALMGRLWDLPFGIAPMGMCNLAWPETDRALGDAARDFSIPHCLSTAASTSLEDARARAGDSAWFQLYVGAPEAGRELVQRALDAGYEHLVLTLDTPVLSRRRRELRRGFTVPFRLGPSQFLDFALHPGWTLATLVHGVPGFENNRPEPDGSSPSFDRSHARAAVDWAFFDALRERWPHRLIAKGVLAPEDAVRIRDAGADAVYVSNHGGRQLDSAPAAIEVLPAIRRAVRPGLSAAVRRWSA